MIKAIIFDCFGVLCSDGWLPYKERNFSGNTVLHEEATRLNKAVDAGKISYTEFLRKVAELAGLPIATARLQIEHNVPDPKVFTLIERLKPQYKIGLLSNAGENWLDEIFKPDQVALFDAVTLSCEIGAIKPQPQAYMTIAEKLGVIPTECVFIDDQPKYAKGAQDTGMQSIVFSNLLQLQSDLESLFKPTQSEN